MGKLNKLAWALLVCILVLTGCSAESSSSEAIASVYRSAAEELVEADDYAGALEVLEEGIATTDDADLRQYAEEVRALQAEYESMSELPEEDESSEALPEEAPEEAPEEPEPPEEDTPDPFDLLPYLGTVGPPRISLMQTAV